jgi:hypothetical protein
MTRTAAQLEASRSNGACSTGPASAEGRARSAQNARTHGFRGAALCFADGDDEARFRALEESVQQRFAPRCPLEAAICARITVALWRCERADRLETEYWNMGSRTRLPGQTMRMVHTIEGDQLTGTRSLATVLRYQADARNALAKALRDLEKLRSGRLDLADEEPAEAAGPPPPDFTKQPQRLPFAAPPAPARAFQPPGEPAGPATASLLNRHERRRLAALRR